MFTEIVRDDFWCYKSTEIDPTLVEDSDATQRDRFQR